MSAPTNDNIIIQAVDNDDVVNSSLLLDPDNTLTRLEQWSSQNSESFNTSDWSTGVYTNQGGLGAVQFTGAATIVDFVNSVFGATGHIFISVNGGPLLFLDGTGGGATDITFYTPTLPAVNPTVVTTFDYYYSYKSGFEIDYDSNEVNIYANDADITLLTTSQRDISLDSSGDVTITANSASTWTFGTDGNLSAPGNVSAVGNVTTGNVLTGGLISATANVTGGNILTGGLISAIGNITGGNLVTAGSGGNITLTGGNITGANVITANIFSATGNITGNYIFGNGSQLTGLPATYGNANVATFLAAYGSNTISTSGNVTAGNLIGNISITGNVQGTTANVTLVAGAYSTVFDNTGNLTLPGNTFAVNYANNTPVDAVTRVEGSWTVTAGTNNYSFTVPINNTYQLWINGNIPNGIIVYNATVSVSNTNVPVIGQQFAWNYEGGGNILMFNSIPAQIIGTAGAIANAQPAVANTNVFSFGINNTSGGNVTVSYGWIQIS
jgi:hypothetical protein